MKFLVIPVKTLEMFSVFPLSEGKFCFREKEFPLYFFIKKIFFLNC